MSQRASARLVRAVAAERDELDRERGRLLRRHEGLLAEVEGVEAVLAELGERIALLDRLSPPEETAAPVPARRTRERVRTDREAVRHPEDLGAAGGTAPPLAPGPGPSSGSGVGLTGRSPRSDARSSGPSAPGASRSDARLSGPSSPASSRSDARSSRPSSPASSRSDARSSRPSSPASSRSDAHSSGWSAHPSSGPDDRASGPSAPAPSRPAAPQARGTGDGGRGGSRVLRGTAIREEAARALAGRPEAAGGMHYADWLALLEEAGWVVAGKDPRAVFLTQVSRSPVVRRTTQPGVYALDADAPRRLRRRLHVLQDELAQVAAARGDGPEARRRRHELTLAIGRAERALEEAVRVLGPGGEGAAAPRLAVAT